MTIESNRESPSTDTNTQPSPQSPSVTPKSSAEVNVTKELAREFRWVELAQIGSNVILAIVGIVAVCVYIGQLKEMRRSTEAARVAADAAKRAADTAANQLELSERPWIKISFTIGVQGFSFQSGSATLPLQAHIQNTGHSVATRVIVPVKMFLAYDENGIFKEPLKQQKELCDPVAEKPTGGEPQLGDMALTIFPGDTDVSMNYGVGVGKDELESAKTLIPQGESFPKVGGGKRILPIIVGCVDYQYATSTHHHQTRFIYQVQRIDRSLPPKIYPIISIEVPKTVAPADVVLQKYGFGGFWAN